jgi:hypothetical protein
LSASGSGIVRVFIFPLYQWTRLLTTFAHRNTLETMHGSGSGSFSVKGGV